MTAPPADPPRSRRRAPVTVLALAIAVVGGAAGAVWTAAPAGEPAARGVMLGEGEWALTAATGQAIALGGPEEARIVPGDVLALRQTVHLDLRETARVRIDAHTITAPGLAPYVTVTVDIPGLADAAIADTRVAPHGQRDDAATAPPEASAFLVTPAQSGTYNAYLQVAFAPETPARDGVEATLTVDRLNFVVEAARE